MKRLLPALFLAATTTLMADAPRQLHWKSEMSGTGVPPGLSSETWVKGDRVRTVMNTPLGDSTVVVKDKYVYTKTGNTAMKMPIEGGQQGPMPKPIDYATRLKDLLKGGTKLGTETIDGEKCEKWRLVQTGGTANGEQTLWISPSLNFPRQISVKTQGAEIIVKNTDIETKVTIDDKLFEPEKGVNYVEMPAPGGGMRPAAAPAKPAVAPAKPPAEPVKPKQ